MSCRGWRGTAAKETCEIFAILHKEAQHNLYNGYTGDTAECFRVPGLPGQNFQMQMTSSGRPNGEGRREEAKKVPGLKFIDFSRFCTCCINWIYTFCNFASIVPRSLPFVGSIHSANWRLATGRYGRFGATHELQAKSGTDNQEQSQSCRKWSMNRYEYELWEVFSFAHPIMPRAGASKSLFPMTWWLQMTSANKKSEASWHLQCQDRLHWDGDQKKAEPNQISSWCAHQNGVL